MQSGGYIQLRIDLGGGEKTLNIMTVQINNGLLHNLTLTRRGPDIVLLLDNKYRTSDTLNITNDPLTSVFLDITSLTAGGSPTNRQVGNFHGCIQKLTLDGHDLPINGETSAFRARSNQPVLPCSESTDPTPPYVITVISTLYVMFAIGLFCLLITGVTFVFICKMTHYSYTRKKGSHSINRRNGGTAGTRFIDFTPTRLSPASTIDHNFARRERGLQSTTSFEPLDMTSRHGYEAFRRIRESPSLVSESVFEVIDEYEIDPVPLIQSSPERVRQYEVPVSFSRNVLPVPLKPPPSPPSRPPLSPPHSTPSSLPPSPPPSPPPLTFPPLSSSVEQPPPPPTAAIHPKSLELLELMESRFKELSEMDTSSELPSFREPELLDPMTGMPLHGSNESILEQHDGIEEERIEEREEEREEEEETTEEEEEDIEAYINERVQCANSLLAEINYDTTWEYCDEGQYDPLGSIGSLYDILDQFEQDSLQGPLSPPSPIKTKKLHSPKHSSPQKPSPLLQSAKRPPPPLKPKPSLKTSKSKTKEVPSVQSKVSPNTSSSSKTKKKSSPPRFHQLNKLTGEELSPSLGGHSRLKKHTHGSVTQL